MKKILILIVIVFVLLLCDFRLIELNIGHDPRPNDFRVFLFDQQGSSWDIYFLGNKIN